MINPRELSHEPCVFGDLQGFGRLEHVLLYRSQIVSPSVEKTTDTTPNAWCYLLSRLRLVGAWRTVLSCCGLFCLNLATCSNCF